MGTDTCAQRVWDNGDMTDCGAAPTVGTTRLCEPCLERRVAYAKVHAENAEAEAQKARAEYARLHTALENNRLPLLALMRVPT